MLTYCLCMSMCVLQMLTEWLSIENCINSNDTLTMSKANKFILDISFVRYLDVAALTQVEPVLLDEKPTLKSARKREQNVSGACAAIARRTMIMESFFVSLLSFLY